VISSRKQAKVDKALETLRKDNLECHGLVCHVAKQTDRLRLVEEVSKFCFIIFNRHDLMSDPDLFTFFLP
jgi:hypothetical protein